MNVLQTQTLDQLSNYYKKYDCDKLFKTDLTKTRIKFLH